MKFGNKLVQVRSKRTIFVFTDGIDQSFGKGLFLSISAGVIMAFFYRFVAVSTDLNNFAAPAGGKMTPYAAVFV